MDSRWPADGAATASDETTADGASSDGEFVSLARFRGLERAMSRKAEEAADLSRELAETQAALEAASTPREYRFNPPKQHTPSATDPFETLTWADLGKR